MCLLMCLLCVLKTEAQDGMLVSPEGTDCTLPCWHGLTPGVSTLRDVYHFWKTDPIVLNSLSHFDRKFDDGLDFLWHEWFADPILGEDRIIGSGVRVENGIVRSIGLRSQNPQTLQSLIETYGEPAAFIYFYDITAVEAYFGNAGFDLQLYYPELGLIANCALYYGEPQANYFMVGNAAVRGYKILPANPTLAGFYAEQHGITHESAQRTLDGYAIEEWPGFNARIGEPIAAYLGAPNLIPFIQPFTPPLRVIISRRTYSFPSRYPRSVSYENVLRFHATFNAPVVDFNADDVVISGTAGASHVEVIQVPHSINSYDIEVSGMQQPGTVTVDIPAHTVQDTVGNWNEAGNWVTGSSSYTSTIFYSPRRP
jgi:hypothetical protein